MSAVSDFDCPLMQYMAICLWDSYSPKKKKMILSCFRNQKLFGFYFVEYLKGKKKRKLEWVDYILPK